MGNATDIDIREVAGCTCLRARRATRHLTQIYDRALQPAGLTVNQFGLLAKLLGATLSGHRSLPIGALAARLGMHPTTLNRDLKPLLTQKLVAVTADPGDRRVRAVRLTGKGRAKLVKAVPFWRRAQQRVEEALGADSLRALNTLLDVASEKLER